MAAGRTPLTQPVASETLLGGTLAFAQPAAGFRAPIDGLLLAHFAGRTERLVVDLGAGAGTITLAMLARRAAPRAIAVEREASMVAFLEQNVAANGFASRVKVVHGDVEAFARASRGSADLVVANPPYWSSDATTPGRPLVRRARTGDAGSALPAFLRAARGLLGRGGRACFVWPAGDIETLLAEAARRGLHGKRARFVHAALDGAAQRVLVEFKPGRRAGLVIAPPLFLADEMGQATKELDAIVGG